MTATSVGLARMFVGALIANPERLGEYPDALDILGDDKMSISAFNALVKLGKGSPQSIAALMSLNGWKDATAESVQQNFIAPATAFGEPDPSDFYRTARLVMDSRSVSSKISAISRELDLGKISPRQAIEQAGTIPISDLSERAVLSSEEMLIKVPQMFEQRRAMLAKKNLLTPPPGFPTLRREMGMIEFGTILSIVAKSGVGKSITAMDWADHWARNCGRSVLYVSTELPIFILTCRYINKMTGVPLEKLRSGYWDDVCAAALAPYQSGGRIHWMEGAGMTPAAIFAEARKRKADVILDYFDMMDVGKSKFAGDYNANKTDLIGHALTEAKEYAQPNDKVVMILWQVGKASEDDPEVSISDAMDSIKPKHRSNYALALNFPKAISMFEHSIPPMPGEGVLDMGKLVDRPGQFSAMGTLTIEKDSFSGKSGVKFPIFRDGARSRLYECGVKKQSLEQPLL